jgi:hypothetical protein
MGQPRSSYGSTDTCLLGRVRYRLQHCTARTMGPVHQHQHGHQPPCPPSSVHSPGGTPLDFPLPPPFRASPPHAHAHPIHLIPGVLGVCCCVTFPSASRSPSTTDARVDPGLLFADMDSAVFLSSSRSLARGSFHCRPSSTTPLLASLHHPGRDCVVCTSCSSEQKGRQPGQRPGSSPPAPTPSLGPALSRLCRMTMSTKETGPQAVSPLLLTLFPPSRGTCLA